MVQFFLPHSVHAELFSRREVHKTLDWATVVRRVVLRRSMVQNNALFRCTWHISAGQMVTQFE